MFASLMMAHVFDKYNLNYFQSVSIEDIFEGVKQYFKQFQSCSGLRVELEN